MSLPRLYVETTIPSYLVARPSRDVILAGQQEITRRWWERKRGNYDLYVSELVLEETAAGDPAMAAARHAALAGLPQLAQTPEVDALAARLLERGIIPPVAAPDAEHIALAAVHAMNFLLTWGIGVRRHFLTARALPMIALTLQSAPGIVVAMSLPRLYLETTIPSYLTARPSGNAVIAGHQVTAREWWATCPERFELYVSQFVLDEAGAGDPEAARLRLDALHGLPELPATDGALALASALLAEGAVPERARTDAAHIAVAAVHGMDFLVTWNCRHIANAEMEPRIREVCVRHGWRYPKICTPEQLLPKEEEGDMP